jgi:hypothetical protein
MYFARTPIHRRVSCETTCAIQCQVDVRSGRNFGEIKVVADFAADLRTQSDCRGSAQQSTLQGITPLSPHRCARHDDIMLPIGVVVRGK